MTGSKIAGARGLGTLVARPAGLEFVLLALTAFCSSWRPAGAEADYAGSETCLTCHEAEFEAWLDSQHGGALREATAENVLGLFDGASLEISGVGARFYIENGNYMAEIADPGSEPESWRILYTIGVAPLQQYVVDTGAGHLQVLDLAWDAQAQRWFHLYPDNVPPPGDGFHWTGPYKSWQARCAVCHQTGFEKAYDPEARTYGSTWAELTVGCEACHGPASEHVA